MGLSEQRDRGSSVLRGGDWKDSVQEKPAGLSNRAAGGMWEKREGGRQTEPEDQSLWPKQ